MWLRLEKKMNYINEEGMWRDAEVRADYARFMREHSRDIVSGKFSTRFDFSLSYVYILDVEINEFPECAPEGYALLAARGDLAVAYWNGDRQSLMILRKPKGEREGTDACIYDAFVYNFIWQDCYAGIESWLMSNMDICR